jgi:cytoskeleton protein RodZ
VKITGELLKAERLKQDLKISDVAFALKLGNKIIQALEEGDPESLPAKTFVRGFVKSYAEFLKLDSQLVLKQFQEEMGSTNPVPKLPPPMPVRSPTQIVEKQKPKAEKTAKSVNDKIGTGLNQKHMFTFFAVSLLVAIIGFVNHFINKYSKERLEINLVVAKPVVSAVTASSDQQSANLLIMSQTVPLSSDATTAIEKADPNAVAEAPVTEKTNQFPALEKSKEKPVEILIEAKKNVTIQYAKGNSKTFEKISIKENSYQIIRSQTGLHLRTEDATHIVLTVNGITQAPVKSKQLQLSF